MIKVRNLVATCQVQFLGTNSCCTDAQQSMAIYLCFRETWSDASIVRTNFFGPKTSISCTSKIFRLTADGDLETCSDNHAFHRGCAPRCSIFCAQHVILRAKFLRVGDLTVYTNFHGAWTSRRAALLFWNVQCISRQTLECAFFGN